jgi:hypothetical protein
VDDGMACNVKEDSIEHLFSFTCDVFKITIRYPEMYVELHIIQMNEERVIHIDQIRYILSKLKYGYENYNPLVILVGPNSVSNLSLHMGDGNKKNSTYIRTPLLTCLLFRPNVFSTYWPPSSKPKTLGIAILTTFAHHLRYIKYFEKMTLINIVIF